MTSPEIKNKVYLVTHTHWDRMWYFTEKAGKILLEYHFKEYLDFLIKNPDYPIFILDGQALILEDYFAFYPDDKAKFYDLVAQKRIGIGPSFYQNEQVLVRGESITRNLLYGISTSLKYGKYYEPIMYVPDSFGHSFNLPQIVNNFNIKYFIAYRGWSEEKVAKESNFIWTGPQNSKLYASVLPLSYGLGKYMETDLKILKKRFHNSLDKLFTLSATKQIILPHGNDQAPLPLDLKLAHQNLAKAFPEYDFVESSYYEAVQEIFKEIKPWKTYAGELLEGKHSRVHRSYYSTRMDIKSRHHENEHLLIDILEPLATIAWQNGFHYYQRHLLKIWKKLLILQGHDSLVGANSDLTNNQVLMKNKLLKNEIEEMIKHYLYLIAHGMQDSKITNLQLILFNFNAQVLTGIHTCKVQTNSENFKIQDHNGNNIAFAITSKKRIPPGKVSIKLVEEGKTPIFYEYELEIDDTLMPLSFKSYQIVPKANFLKLTNKWKFKKIISNQFIEIKVNTNGTIDINNKRTKQKIQQALKLISESDVGDNFNYSPLSQDFIISNEKISNLQTKVQENRYSTHLIITYDLAVPANVEERKQKKCLQKLAIYFKITLKNNDPQVYVTSKIFNRAKDHRLRLLIDSQIKSEFSYAGSQYGEYKRLVVDPCLNKWDQKQEGLSEWEAWKKIAWAEKPISVYPFVNYVATKKAKNYFAVINNTSREYELVGPNYSIIALTLYRAVSHCGKSDLLYRPGRMSGVDLATPDSQLIKQEIKHKFVIATQTNNPGLLAKQVLTPIYTAMKTPYQQFTLNNIVKKLPHEYSLFSIKSNLILESIKKSENDNSIIIKMYANKNLQITKDIIGKAWKVKRVQLDETTEITWNNWIETNEIVVLKVNLKQDV